MGDKYIKSGTDAFGKQAMDAPGRLESEQRTAAGRDRITIVAYFNSQRRGFATSGELNDWLNAERDAAAHIK